MSAATRRFIRYGNGLVHEMYATPITERNHGRARRAKESNRMVEEFAKMGVAASVALPTPTFDTAVASSWLTDGSPCRRDRKLVFFSLYLPNHVSNAMR
jgi:hypothetical protein